MLSMLPAAMCASSKTASAYVASAVRSASEKRESERRVADGRSLLFASFDEVRVDLVGVSRLRQCGVVAADRELVPVVVVVLLSNVGTTTMTIGVSPPALFADTSSVTARATRVLHEPPGITNVAVPAARPVRRGWVERGRSGAEDIGSLGASAGGWSVANGVGASAGANGHRSAHGASTDQQAVSRLSPARAIILLQGGRSVEIILHDAGNPRPAAFFRTPQLISRGPPPRCRSAAAHLLFLVR